MKLLSAFTNTAILLGLAVGANAQSASSAHVALAADTVMVSQLPADSGYLPKNGGKHFRHRRSPESFEAEMKRLDSLRSKSDELAQRADSIMRARFSNIDTAGNNFCYVRPRMGRGHRDFGRLAPNFADSLVQRSSSIVVINDGKKTMVIKDGKDTSYFDSNAPIPEIQNFSAMPPMFDFPDFDKIFSSNAMPDFSSLPDWFNNNDRGDFFAAPHRNGFTAENPSDEEIDMLVKNKAVTSANLKSPLDVLDMRLAPSRSAIMFTYKLPRAQKSTVKIVGADGKVLDSATLSVQGGEFRRTFKLNDSQQYLYIIISADSKFAVSKFWL